MREHRYRAWDSYQKKMYSWDEIGEMNGHGYLSLWNALIGMTEHITMMDSTGLKDANGIEIYEKDIIILEPDEAKEYFNEPTNLSYGDVCIVEWSNTNLAYYLMPVNEDIEEQQMDYYGAWSGWNWIKIIGNCYENPELLKGA